MKKTKNTQEIEQSQCKITDREKQLDLDCQDNPKSQDFLT